jgi:hypothetical protein
MSKNKYIDNKKFTEVMTEYVIKYKKAKTANTILPRIPEYGGECFILIAENFAKKPNFNNYSYLSDMVSESVENCVLYAHNFNPEISNNAFSYFTQYVYNAFIRRIDKEKKQMYIKYQNYVNMNLEDNLVLDGVDVQELNEISSNFIEDYEKILQKRKENQAKRKQQTNTVTRFVSNGSINR